MFEARLSVCCFVFEVVGFAALFSDDIMSRSVDLEGTDGSSSSGSFSSALLLTFKTG